MSETVNDYIPGRSLLAEMTELREQMTALKTAMVQLVNLQHDMHTLLVAVLQNKTPITNEGEGEQIHAT
ncbi:MAG: hypothetical protein ABSA33_02860 [Candidatus Micrarchaeaceae archaeon]|jgi:hypothetical protein